MALSFSAAEPPRSPAQFKRFIAELNTELAALADAIAGAGGGGGISDGDKGDITVGSSGTVWTVDELPMDRITNLVSALSGKASSSHAHAISDVSGLQDALDNKAAASVGTEVETARGGAANLNERLSVISNFASPNAGAYVAGRYYDQAFQALASTTLAGAANRMDLSPFYTSLAFDIDQIGVAVSTAVASATAKVVIYEADADLWPSNLLYESSALDCSTTGYKSAALTFSFSSGKMYWMGVRHSATATLRAVTVGSCVNLGLTGNTATSYATLLRSTQTYANAAPDPYTFAQAQLKSANATSIRMRAA